MRWVSLLLIVLPALGEEARPRWAIDPGEHRIRLTVTQRMRLTPPGRAEVAAQADTTETWKAKVEADGEALKVTLTCESIRMKTSGMPAAVEVDAAKVPAEGDWIGKRLAALRAMTFVERMRPDGEVLSIAPASLPLDAPPWLVKEVHEASWDPARVAEPIREMWVLLPPALPKDREVLAREDTASGTRRVRSWLWTEPSQPREAKQLEYSSTFPDGAPAADHDAMASISPDLVSVGWDQPRETGHVDLDAATGVVARAQSFFAAKTRVRVRNGEMVEMWQGEVSIDRTLTIEPPQ